MSMRRGHIQSLAGGVLLTMGVLAPAAKVAAQETAPVTAVSLQQMLDDDRYLEFASALGHADGLTPEQHEFFLGMLAFHLGRFEDAITPLVRAANSTTASLTPQQVEEALETLGENAMKQSKYGASAQMYDVIDKTWGARMPDGGRLNRQKRHFAALLQHVPAQSVNIDDDFTLAGSGGEYPASVGGKTIAAVLDTGAEISVLTESTATKWGVTMLEGTATLEGYGGKGFSARPGYIAELTIGKATLRNVAVYVTADENLYIAPIKHQANALLGFPVVTALGRLTFARGGNLTVSATSPVANPKVDARLWFGGHALLVPLGTIPLLRDGKVQGGVGERLFMLDTGSGSTYLTDHYLAEHMNVFHGPPPEMAKLAGAGGVGQIPAYGARDLPLFVGQMMMLINGPHVLATPAEGEVEHYFGLLGRDVLDRFASYTLDFRTGAFRVQP